uniref:hypothetical protein n=1 Tax=Lacrimispora sp. TaxID=2719234 RepID=UPI0028A67100
VRVRTDDRYITMCGFEGMCNELHTIKNKEESVSPSLDLRFFIFSKNMLDGYGRYFLSKSKERTY